jgi:hypothetical protein
MSDDVKKESPGKEVSVTAKPEDTTGAANELSRLRADSARYRAALEEIRDQTFVQANSSRLIDQLWTFVRWTKATARTALESPGEKQKS